MGWLAGCILIMSMLFIGDKSILGPILGVIGNTIWVFIGFNRKQYDLVFVALAMTIMSLRAVLIWMGWM